MKLIKLSVISMAVLGTTAAMAEQPQSYQYNPDDGIVRNTTGAVVGSTKTLFDTATHPAAVSAEIGTLGYGANVAWGLNDSTELQAGWSGMSLDGDVDLNAKDSWINWEKALGDEYKDFKGKLDYTVKASNPYLGVQMRPLNNWLTVGAGVMVPRNRIDATLTANEVAPVKINDIEYEVEDGSSVQVKARNKNALAPYATLGFRPNINNRWGMFAEVGAAYMGDYTSDVTVNGNVKLKGVNANAQTQAVAQTVTDIKKDFENRAEQEINDNDLKWYPIAKVGVTYRF